MTITAAYRALKGMQQAAVLDSGLFRASATGQQPIRITRFWWPKKKKKR